MFNNRRKIFAFLSGAVPPDTFEVVRFDGTEGLSRLFRYDITLVSENEEIDLKAMVKHPASLVILRDVDDYPVHGMLSTFEQSGKQGRYTYYRAVLVPRIWQTDRYLETQLFIDKSVPDIIKEIFKQAGIEPNHYALRLIGSYPKWEYICQYRETDFDFISRWMEREGIYYYFEQTENCEKMIITDSLNVHVPVKDESKKYYHPPSGLAPAEEDVVFALTGTYNSLPHKVVLRDYNYRKPTLDLTCEAVVDPEGYGKAYTYGEHYKTPEEGRALAKIRAQELLCNEMVFNGESTAPILAAGFFFELAEHYRQDYDQKYLITDVAHTGNQNGHLFSGRNGANGDDPDYFNRFTAIPAEVQYRPPRKTTQPKITGTMNATVDSQGSGRYAEIDELGRYKVRLPFDMADKNKMKASRWVRMTQHYAGPDYGSHFPLHKDTEVVLSFIDGNPDRPFIAGAVPNPDTISPITAGNLTKSMIRSAGGNEYHLEDKAGRENIYTHAVKDQTTDVVNDRNKTIGRNETMQIGRNRSKTVGNNQIETIGADKAIQVGSNHDETVGADMTLTVGSNRTTTIAQNATTTVAGAATTRVGDKRSLDVAKAYKMNVGSSKKETVAKSSSENVGKMKMVNIGGLYSINVGAAMNTITALANSEEAGIAKVIVAGKSIMIKCAGNIKIDGKNIEITGKEGVKINGKIIDLN